MVVYLQYKQKHKDMKEYLAAVKAYEANKTNENYHIAMNLLKAYRDARGSKSK